MDEPEPRPPWPFPSTIHITMTKSEARDVLAALGAIPTPPTAVAELVAKLKEALA